jgi:hypothetical protein
MLLAAGHATGPYLLSLDDPSIDTDQGGQIAASFVSTAFDSGPADGFATLRRLVQAVTLSNTATVALTPIGDGSEVTGQRMVFTLSATNGTAQILDAPTMVPGTRFQQKVEVVAHTGSLEFGEADQWFVHRRSAR